LYLLFVRQTSVFAKEESEQTKIGWYEHKVVWKRWVYSKYLQWSSNKAQDVFQALPAPRTSDFERGCSCSRWSNIPNFSDVCL